MDHSPSSHWVTRVRARIVELVRNRPLLVDGLGWLERSWWRVFLLFVLVSAALYTRSPFSNSIFDEQEALLANPYVNGKGLGFFQVLQCDFWGLPADRSIGSYRPLPNLIWRCLWTLHDHPWVPHALNVVLHALNALLVMRIARAWTASRPVAWLSGACFVACAVLTETVSGVVGLADVLSGLGLLTAVAALSLSEARMLVGVFAASVLAMFSKESSIALAAIVPWAALLSARVLHPERPRTVLRVLLSLVATVAAVVLYVETRRRFFPSPIEDALLQPAAPDWHWSKRLFHELLRWFSQPKLPHDPINNPLVGVAWPERVATALRIYLSGLGQVLWPSVLSGDYSFAAELPEADPLSVRAAIGASALGIPVLAALVLAVVSWLPTTSSSLRRTAALLGLGLMLVPVTYIPQSNLLVLLPTIRAERFWYLPVIGMVWLLGCAWAALLQPPLVHLSPAVGSPLNGVPRPRLRKWCGAALALFLGFQALQARRHACDYTSDLHFWRATAKASPNSAKAHLNYGVMLGARGELEQRLSETERAQRIAPQWPMAHVYLGDTLCRMQRAADAWPHYRRGFELGPNEPNLIALGLQCLWDQQLFTPHQIDLQLLAAEFPGSWLEYLVTDMVDHGAEHGGVDKKYRPRGYDEGPASP
jgi:hypothetical protein